MNINEKREAVANYIIDNKATISKTADAFNMSPSSIKKIVNVYLPTMNADLYRKVKAIQAEISAMSVSAGGKISKRPKTISKEAALEIAKVMLERDYTVEEASEYFKIPSSTLYETIKNIEDETVKVELDNMFIEHKKNAPYNQINVR